MKRLNRLLSIVMAAFIGAFLGHGLYLAWDFHARPELYASWSAPWYAQLLVPGIVLVCVGRRWKMGNLPLSKKEAVNLTLQNI